MCGIAAVSLSPSSTIPIRQLMHELLLHSEERGKVASGYAFHYAGENKYVKDAKPGGHLPLKLLPRDARLAIAHTRNATYGNPEENDNNHPVVDDKEEILLVHNGVITNHEAIRAGEKDVVFPEVDSAVLPWLIRTEGVAGLQHVDGWAAVAWLDKVEPGVLNLARVQGSAPMVVVYLDDGSVVMGSTFPIIHASLIRIGYGERIVGGYEVPDLTHIQVKAGAIGLMSNIPKYTQFNAKYKGKHMTHAEKQRLEKITNGDAVSYGKDNPQHAPKGSTYVSGAVSQGSTVTNKNPPVTTPPSAGSLASAGVNPAYKSPYASGGYSGAGFASGGPSTSSTIGTTKYEPPKPKHLDYKPGDDPMAAFEKAKASAPSAPPGRPMPQGKQKYLIPLHLERRLTYWIQWVDQPGVRDKDLFIPSDFGKDGYLYEAFMDICNDSYRRGLAKSWGVYDHEGVPRYSHELRTVQEEVDAFIALAKELPPAPKRKTPKARTSPTPPPPATTSVPLDGVEEPSTGEVTADSDGNVGVVVNGQFKPMWQLTNEEWAEAFGDYGYSGLG